MMFKKLAQKLAADREKYSSVALNPINADFDERKKTLLNKMSENVVNMYERQADIKKFTKLALSPKMILITKSLMHCFCEAL